MYNIGKKEMEPDELKKLCEHEISNAKKIIMSSKTIIAAESQRQSIYEYVLKDLVDISNMFYFQYSTKRKKINKNATMKMHDEELIKKINVKALRVLRQKYDDAVGGLPNCQGEGMALFRFFHWLLYSHTKK